MSTGIVAALANAGSVTYVPSTTAKVKINWAGASTNLTVNGVVVATGIAGIVCGTVEFYMAGNTSVTITTGAAMTALVSAIEEL